VTKLPPEVAKQPLEVPQTGFGLPQTLVGIKLLWLQKPLTAFAIALSHLMSEKSTPLEGN
jgi:hypothetical protein